MPILILLTLLSLGDAAKILGVFNHPAKSHTFLGTVLFEELASRGHEVTFVNAYPTRNTQSNYKNIVIEGIAQDLINREMIYFNHKSDQIRIILESLEMSLVHMAATFENPQLKEIISSNHTFDLVICDYFYNDANLILGHVFKAPVILLSSFGNTLATSHFTGNDLPFSYVPGCSLQLDDNMDFWERLRMTISGSTLLWILRDSRRRHTELMEKYFDDVPSMEDLYNNVAVVLANSHYSFETVRPSTPNIIPIGGFHLKSPKPLEKELRQLMETSENCVIYFSLGSQIKTSNMGNKTIKAFLDVFTKSGCQVLWKFEKRHEGNAHPKTKVFITHGGTLSMIEALNYGVPMIAIPFNGDQHMNAKFIETRKLGKLLNLEDVAEETFGEVLSSIIGDPIFQKNARQYSSLLRNQPIKPLDNAIFWIEHVIAHKGSPHLKPASIKLSWIQYHLIDVYAVILGTIFLILSSVLILIYVVLSKLGYFSTMKKLKIS
ncbi:hypothetical protein HHI36_003678 [Cryptolaemus montrouzieri]|uniref:UDP-glucuronosyltransferase n=1 Tax=Cryptolaemus montrouzieri TaxID=559131 RepID=A0ABD2PE29_9CUCU